MREAAQVVRAKKGVHRGYHCRPHCEVERSAMQDADLIFSGSEYMMHDFATKDLPGLIDPATIRTLYLRPSAILVRPGNPKKHNGRLKIWPNRI